MKKTSILDVYDEATQELLILGAPGAGKSTLLIIGGQESRMIKVLCMLIELLYQPRLLPPQTPHAVTACLLRLLAHRPPMP